MIKNTREREREKMRKHTHTLSGGNCPSQAGTLTSSLASDGRVVDFDTVTGQLEAEAAMEETTEEGEEPFRWAALLTTTPFKPFTPFMPFMAPCAAVGSPAMAAAIEAFIRLAGSCEAAIRVEAGRPAPPSSWW